MPAAPPQPAIGQFTNAPDVTESGAIFVVLDTIHTRYLDERDMRGMILKFMARAAESQTCRNARHPQREGSYCLPRLPFRP